MIRAWSALGIAVSIVGVVSAQDSKPPVAGAAETQSAPTAPHNLPSTDENTSPYPGVAAYQIEMKVVEGKGPFGDGLDSRSPDAVFPEGFDRRTLDNLIAAGSLPFPSLYQETSAVSHADGNHSGKQSSPTKTERESAEYSIWHMHLDNPQVRTLLAPKLSVPAKREKQTGYIAVENTQTFPYLEPLGKDNFHLKRTDAQKLGMKISVGVRPMDGDDGVAEVSLDIKTTSLDGREAVEGLDLDAGKPIIATRSLKTSATMMLGVTRLVTIPSGPATQAALLLRIKRLEPQKKN